MNVQVIGVYIYIYIYIYIHFFFSRFILYIYIYIYSLFSALLALNDYINTLICVRIPIFASIIINAATQYFWCVCVYIYIYTVGTESIQTPLHFSLFVYCSHLLKSFKFIFFSSLMYTQHPILTEKHRLVDIFADLLKKKN